MATVSVKGRKFDNIDRLLLTGGIDEVTMPPVDKEGNVEDVCFTASKIKIHVKGNVGEARVKSNIYINGDVGEANISNVLDIEGYIIGDTKHKDIRVDAGISIKSFLNRELERLSTNYRRFSVIHVEGDLTILCTEVKRVPIVPVITGNVGNVICNSCAFVKGRVKDCYAYNAIRVSKVMNKLR